jgi:hypothetical protein
LKKSLVIGMFTFLGPAVARDSKGSSMAVASSLDCEATAGHMRSGIYRDATGAIDVILGLFRPEPCELMVLSLPIGGAELGGSGEPPDVLPAQLDVTERKVLFDVRDRGRDSEHAVVVG